MGVLIDFALSMPNFFEYVTSILHLTNESFLFDLLDLKSKKKCENPHHGHFKHIRHYFAKFITK
jgi:hypothetical protein